MRKRLTYGETHSLAKNMDEVDASSFLLEPVAEPITIFIDFVFL